MIFLENMLGFEHALMYGVMLFFNYLAAATTLVGGMKTGDVVKNIKTFADPAPYAFSIWSVIYLLLGYDVFFGVKNNCSSTFFFLMCCLNIAWLINWGFKRWSSSQMLILAYCFVLYKITLCQNVP